MAVVVPYVIMTAVGVATAYVVTSIAKKQYEGSRIGDIAVQTSKEGGAIPIVWGIVRPISGNIIACSDPIRKSHREGGSDGIFGIGGSSGVKVRTIHRTYAVGICEGPATIRRVWRNNKLVYDGRLDNEWGDINNPTFLDRATLYRGDYSQTPSPVLETVFGVGNVPAMRGICYMVMREEDVTDMSGALPNWIFEVCRAEGIYVTSRPYPVEVDEELKTVDIDILSGDFMHLINSYDYGTEDLCTFDVDLVSGDFADKYLSYSYNDQLETSNIDVVSGVFKDVLWQYSYDDELETTNIDITSGVFKDVFVEYTYWEPEDLETKTINLVSGVHEN